MQERISPDSDVRIVQDLSQFVLPNGFRGRSAIVCQLWWIVQETLFRWSPQFAYGFRRTLLRTFGCRVGSGVIIRPTVRITYPWKVSIADNVWIGDHAELYSLGDIVVEHDAVISQNCYLCTGSHDASDVRFPIFVRRITIESEAWLCADVFVMPGVTIGRGAVVGARSLVTSDIPSLKMAVGSPARVKCDRPHRS